jgi:anaerobic ribonucleoside-triphosphate reductase activating protein
MDNDIVDGIEGISVSFWTQGCPFHCPGCHNKDTWDFNGGKQLPSNYIERVYNKLIANGITRNLSILGGEPLCPENLAIVHRLCSDIKKRLPTVKILLWTGYTLQQLKVRAKTDIRLQDLINECLDTIVDGPYKQDLRDLRLKLRGSSNQKVWKRTKSKFLKRTIWKEEKED